MSISEPLPPSTQRVFRPDPRSFELREEHHRATFSACELPPSTMLITIHGEIDATNSMAMALCSDGDTPSDVAASHASDSTPQAPSRRAAAATIANRRKDRTRVTYGPPPTRGGQGSFSGHHGGLPFPGGQNGGRISP